VVTVLKSLHYETIEELNDLKLRQLFGNFFSGKVFSKVTLDSDLKIVCWNFNISGPSNCELFSEIIYGHGREEAFWHLGCVQGGTPNWFLDVREGNKYYISPDGDFVVVISLVFGWSHYHVYLK